MIDDHSCHFFQSLPMNLLVHKPVAGPRVSDANKIYPMKGTLNNISDIESTKTRMLEANLNLERSMIVC